MMPPISRTVVRASGRFRLFCIVLAVFLSFVFLLSPRRGVEAYTGINNTRHNLSVSGPGPIKSSTETRICIFCHTPHDAYRPAGAVGGSGPVAPADYTYLPLWNHEVTTAPETGLYWSSTMKATLSQPTGPTKLCLSCHDGTVALGAVGGGANLGITNTMNDYYPSSAGGPGPNLGTDLSTDHPVSFPYSASLPNPELASLASLPDAIKNRLYGGDAELHCSTCHDPHDDTYGNFLVMDNSSSQLCETCHLLTGWDVSAHNQCEDCHTPHFAVQGEWLLNFSSYDACLTAGCHGSNPVHTQATATASQSAQTAAMLTRLQNVQTDAVLSQPPIGTVDIKSQIEKMSSHHAAAGARILSQQQQLADRQFDARGVTCVACHSPHEVNKKRASAPYASGMLEGVSGIDRNGNEVASVTYEYEVCFKCHSDYSTDFAFIPRVITNTNTRLAFDPDNPSYHPVVGMGRTLSVPSIPSSLAPALTASSMIYCTDCHSDDAGGSRGPHGSSFPPILRERYETADGTAESYQNYALCYRCHNRDSILRDDSFRKDIFGKGGHSGHLADGAPCSACHDPHGVDVSAPSAPQGTGSHTHLINFDTLIVQPKPGNAYPIYTDNGNFSGSCTLLCHGKLHDNLSYP